MSPPALSLDLAVSAVSLAGIVLPVVGVIAAVLPYLVAVLVALVRRDSGGPFVPHTRLVQSRTVAGLCIGLGLVALYLIQPRFFRLNTGPARVEAAGIETDALRPLVEPHVAALVDSGDCVGIVVGIVDGSGRHVLGFGRSSLSHDAPPTGATVFEIGAMTQLFTASLLARMAEKGTVRLDQSVQSLLPDTVSVPLAGDRQIELQHLATYTSGLPRLKPDPATLMLGELFPPMSGMMSRYTTAWLYEVISSIDIGQAPGSRIDDSDLGVGLLGHVLERAGGADYETLLQREICEPLGMKETRIKLTPAMKGRRAAGVRAGWGNYRGWRVASPYGRWQGGVLVGAGGLSSTADDLLTLLEVHLGRSQSSLAATLAETRRPRYHVEGRPDVGLGCYVSSAATGEPIVWQHGVTGGCRSYIAMLEGRGLGVVVLANSPIDIDRLGNAILLGLAARSAA